MDEIVLFDKDGNQFNLKDAIFNFLKDNLEITISTSKEYDHGTEYISITSSVSLNNKKISESSDVIYLKN